MSDSNGNGTPEKNIVLTYDPNETNNPYGSGNGLYPGAGSGWTFSFGGGSSNRSSGGRYGPGGLSNSRRRRLRLAARAQREFEARAHAQREQEIAANARALAEQQQAVASANAQAIAAQQAHAAHQQKRAEQTQQYHSAKAAIDTDFGNRSQQLESKLQDEVNDAVRAPTPENSSDSWQVYILKKKIAEIEGVIAQKATVLQSTIAQANSFYGSNPLIHSVEDYLSKATTNPAAQQAWEGAYRAAQLAVELSESIRLLTEKTNALVAQIPVKEALARAAEERRQLHQVALDKNQEHLRFKIKADEIVRLEQLSAANTVSVPVAQGLGAAVITRTGAIVAQGAAVAIDAAIRAAVMTIGRSLVASPLGATVAVFASTALYSMPIANGELTSEQRRQLFQGIAVDPEALGLPEGTDLNSIANAGGEVALRNRLSIENAAEGAKVNVVATGGAIASGVKVIHATANPQSNSYTAKLAGPLGQTLNFTLENNPATTEDGDWPIDSPNLALQSSPYVEDMPSGADRRINDCIVCIPGLAPRYFSFPPPPLESGIVLGIGQPASGKWWGEAKATGAKIPSSIADRSRGKAFPTLNAFENDFWRELATESTANDELSEANRNRLNKGYAPIAPKSQWLGVKKTYQLNDRKTPVQRDGALNLDDFSVGTPSRHGIRPDSPAATPWSVPDSPGMRGLMGTLAQQREAALRWFEQAIEAESQPGTRTETPRTPPGSEAIGSTTLPTSPPLPTIYPGETTDPVQTQTDPLPGLDPADVNANISGLPSDEELPSPGVMEAGPPVKPLEVGPYNELANRSNLDQLDIDHISSRRALETYILNKNPDITSHRLRYFLQRAPSIAIPAEVHRKLSETYGGRNTKSKQAEDAKNLLTAVDRNFDAIKPGLLEAGLDETSIEAARDQLHKLNEQQGWY